jgi:hypothetical protein
MWNCVDRARGLLRQNQSYCVLKSSALGRCSLVVASTWGLWLRHTSTLVLLWGRPCQPLGHTLIDRTWVQRTAAESRLPHRDR